MIEIKAIRRKGNWASQEEQLWVLKLSKSSSGGRALAGQSDYACPCWRWTLWPTCLAWLLLRSFTPACDLTLCWPWGRHILGLFSEDLRHWRNCWWQGHPHRAPAPRKDLLYCPYTLGSLPAENKFRCPWWSVSVKDALRTKQKMSFLVLNSPEYAIKAET